MNILVTGVTSFIGRALARELISEGYEVYGVIRPTSKNKNAVVSSMPKLHIIDCDMNECEKIESMELPKMYACINLSWEGAGRGGRMNEEVQNQNECNTKKMIEVAHTLGCERFIVTGSQAEYGVTLERVKEGSVPSTPISETQKCNPLSFYGKAKLRLLEECSEKCKSYGMTYIHSRIYSTYGVGDNDKSLISSIVRAFTNNEHIVLSSCEQMWNYIYVTDCAKAIADLVSCIFTLPEDAELEDHVVNIASEETRYLKDFVIRARQIIGHGSYEFTEPMTSEEGVPFLNPDITKLKRVTGFIPQVTFDEGITNLVAISQIGNEHE